MTAEEFAARHPGDYVELIDGEVVRIRRAGARNGMIGARVIRLFGEATLPSDEWLVCSHDTFVLTGRNPDRVRRADLVLWRREGLPEPTPDLITVPPELVVEMRRPFDVIPDIVRKAVEYTDAGVPLVVVLDPPTRSVGLFRADELPERFGPADTLTLPGVLPGFAVPVAALFG